MHYRVDRTLFLGKQEDALPTWRDEAIFTPWPEPAAFSITFLRERFPRVPIVLPRTEYFGFDGWPIGLPYTTKVLLRANADTFRFDLQLKYDLQVCPRNWRLWSDREWLRALEFVSLFAGPDRLLPVL
jgi:hypothetical protein